MRGLKYGIVGFALCTLLCGFVDSAHAGTIINLNNVPPAIQIQFDGTTLSTVGPQGTSAVFTGFLDWYPDITTSTASLTFGGVTKSGSPIVAAASFVQQFSGGTLSLFDAAHTLLLSGNLSTSALSGTVGLADGGLFTTSFSTVTGGNFAPYVDRPSLVFQMHLSNINGGVGFTTATPTVPILQPFTAAADSNIDGLPQVPEPATIALLTLLYTPTLGSAISRKPRRGYLRTGR